VIVLPRGPAPQNHIREKSMKRLMIALVAGLTSLAFASAYAGESQKSDTGATKSEKGMAKKDEATTKDDDKKKKGKKKDEATTKY
jgi:hypothetical protein